MAYRKRGNVKRKKPSAIDMAWVAGIYEGEGSCSIVRRYSNRPAARIHIGMTDRDVINKVHRIIGMGYVNTYVRLNPRHRNIHTLQISMRADVKLLLRWLLPYAGKRRAKKLREAIALMEAPVLCKKGKHLLTAKNIGEWPRKSLKGIVMCLGCARERHVRAMRAQRKRRAQERKGHS